MMATNIDRLNIDRWMARVPLIARITVACALLCGLILYMVIDRASILRQGVEVRLATEPVDPRDLFRGDYVVLRYQINTVNLTQAGFPGEVPANATVYVGLRANAAGQAQAVKLALAGAPREAGLIWIEGKAGYLTDCDSRPDERPEFVLPCGKDDRMLRVTYGLESYFVPQGEGRAIETTEASRVEIVAAVAPDGRSAIKRLLIDGKPLYDEPPY